MSKRTSDKAPDPEHPAELIEACTVLHIDPSSVLDWKQYEDRVVLVCSDGRKLTVER